ncbi:hypothetical protein L7F22_020856 [Adiantum nelumboides]|nr:hypothetical protein [Adiantum nelumboides]
MIYISVILFVLTALAEHAHVVQSITDPNVLVATLSSSTDQSFFFLNLAVGTPSQKLPLLLDVQSPYTTLRCITNGDLNSTSSTSFRPSLSSTFFAPSPADSCPLGPYSSLTCSCAQDTLSLYIQRTDFPDPLLSANVSDVNFTCCSELDGSAIAAGAAGLVGLSRGDRSLPAQVSKSGGLAQRFSYCLPAIAFFGNVTSYALLNPYAGRMETMTTVLKTRLYYVNGGAGGYAFKVQNMSVNGGAGVMGRPMRMKISTTQMYTTFERKVYKQLRASFRQAVGHGNRTIRRPATAPFDTCFSTRPLIDAQQATYLKAPALRFDVEGGSGWTLYPLSTFVYTSEHEVACLGVFPAAPGQPSVLGSFQQRDCLAEFDLQNSRFSFRSIYNPYGFHPELPRCGSLAYPAYT